MVGDVVLAPFPFTNLQQAKIWPVLVVADVRDGAERDWIVCEITSGRAAHAREVAIMPGNLQSGQLRRRSSRVRPDRLTTLNEEVFRRTIARLTDSKTVEMLASVISLF
ncbi:MAG: type II toxin-antitoxin system PemK/MazF family toxin [Chloroflexi bacterium]|nr:type II toxin-antitoxin system PemK/MazF family toxin [Chloroflexota bacterium]